MGRSLREQTATPEEKKCNESVSFEGERICEPLTRVAHQCCLKTQKRVQECERRICLQVEVLHTSREFERAKLHTDLVDNIIRLHWKRTMLTFAARQTG